MIAYPTSTQNAKPRRNTSILCAIALTALAGGCSTSQDAPSPSQTREFAPHVRIDARTGTVEFDGIVPVDCHDPETPDVYLELVACTPDTREHESLVMTTAKPSHIHAALLAAGYEPGTPGTWRLEGDELVRTLPTGDALEVFIAYKNAQGQEIEAPAQDWIINIATGQTFPGSDMGAAVWLFGGSRIIEYRGEEFYDADGAGTLIGLATFESETLSWRSVISPDSSLDEPEWIANRGLVPSFGTPVVVRLKRPEPN